MEILQASAKNLKPRTKNHGFTLVEVMIATAMLALGAVLIYEVFFGLADSYNYYAHYLDISSGVNEKIWEAKDSIMRNGAQAQVIPSGTFKKGAKDFAWNASISSIGKDTGLYRASLSVNWKEGSRRFNISRLAYTLYKEPN